MSHIFNLIPLCLWVVKRQQWSNKKKEKIEPAKLLDIFLALQATFYRFTDFVDNVLPMLVVILSYSDFLVFFHLPLLTTRMLIRILQQWATPVVSLLPYTCHFAVPQDYLTPLHVAAHCGNVRTAKLVLDRKCEVNARALVSGNIICTQNKPSTRWASCTTLDNHETLTAVRYSALHTDLCCCIFIAVFSSIDHRVLTYWWALGINLLSLYSWSALHSQRIILWIAKLSCELHLSKRCNKTDAELCAFLKKKIKSSGWVCMSTPVEEVSALNLHRLKCYLVIFRTASPHCTSPARRIALK